METFTGKAFYGRLGESKLTGSRCEDCKALHVPPRPMCPRCFSTEMKLEEMSGDGKLIAFTTVHIALTAMIEAGYGRKNPYCAGVIRLAEGPAISGQIVGVDPGKPEDIKIGMPVRATFITRGDGEDIKTFLAFEPLD